MQSTSTLRSIRWFVWLTLLHTVPSPFFLFVVAGTVPAAGLLIVGAAGLFNMDTEGPMMGLLLGGQGLAWAIVYFLLAWLVAALIARVRSVLPRTLMLLAFTAACFFVALQPVYVMGGHGGEHWNNLPSLLEGFRVSPAIMQSYLAGLGLVLGVLLVLQALGEQRWMSRLPSPYLLGGFALVGLLIAVLWAQRVTLFCGPAAGAGQVWAQLCVARAARDLARGGPAPDAVEWYRRAARQGSHDAMRELLAITRSESDRREWLPVLAADGDAQAAADYWRMLRQRSNTTAEELARARGWLVTAAEEGHPAAALELARELLARGEHNAARARFEQAAEQGSGDAIRALAWRYEQSAPGFPLDLARAAALYEQLAEGISADRFSTSGYTQTAGGYGKRAAALREMLDAAQDGSTDARLQWARRILKAGHPGEAGRARALQLLEQAAGQGVVEAQHDLGRLLVLGHRGFDPDFERGRPWWNLAVAQEHLPTLRYVAEARTSGRYGYDIDFEQARREFAILFEAYTEGGRGVAADPREAAHWHSALRDAERKLAALGPDHVPITRLRQQAAAGDADAQYQLGVQLQQAYSVEHHAEAVKWWVRAAAGGHAEAQFRLVSYYLRGDRFVKKDPAEAVRLLQAAADSHHARAMFQLGLVHEKGRHGIERDLQRAGQLYAEILAAESGNPYAWQEESRFYRMVENRVKAVQRMQAIKSGG